MDETIGVKGGHNDQRRRMIISREQKKMLEEYEEQREIEELEKSVKKKQLYTLIKTLPIVIGGNVIQTIHDTAVGKEKEDKEDENSRWRIKEYSSDVSSTSRQEEAREKEERRRKVIVLPTGEKTVVYVEIPEEKYVPHIGLIPEEKKTPHSVPQQVFIEHPIEGTVEEEKQEIPVRHVGVGEVKEEKTSIFPFPKKIEDYTDQEIADAEVIDVESFIDRELTPVDLASLSDDAVKKLEHLKSRRIVDEYEKQLKDIRYELRKVIYEYNVLVDKDEEVVLSKDAEVILDRLSEVITKIEELKRRIKIEDLDKYDDNYIYYLIEGYLKEFRNGRVIKEIEDSPLYVLISKKLDELDEKRGLLSKSVEEKKEKLEEKEEDFDRLKDQYYSIDKLNNQLLEFQYEQDRVLRDIQEKVRNATTETERVTQEFVGMNQQSRRLLRMLSFQMLFPGPRAAKRFAAGAAAYLYFMNNIVRPNTRTRRYRVIVVKDYHDEIKNSISELDSAIELLSKTGTQIEKMMRELEYRYKDYLDYVPEAKELLSNLRKIQSEVEEKEYEMKKIKEQQEKELEKNDAKVKTMGEYPVN